MSTLPSKLIKKLEKVAEILDAEKGLEFFGLIRQDLLPWDRWDVVVSARKLVPWSADAITYIAGLLRKKLNDEEMVKIAQIVALPHNNELIKSLGRNERTSAREIRGLHPMDHFDDAVVIWSAKNSSAQTAKG